MTEICKLCGSEAEIIHNVPHKIYYHCAVCDFIFMAPEYHLSGDEEKERYAQHNNTLDNKGYVNMFKKFMEKTVDPYLSEIDNALDFGCGPGPVLQVLLQRKGIETDIYDPYFYPRKVFKDKKYDLITCTEVVEHIENPLQVFKMLCTHLNQGGKLAVMTLFHNGTSDFHNWWYKKDPTHISFYSQKTFRWLEETLPLKIVVMDNKNTLCMEKI